VYKRAPNIEVRGKGKHANSDSAVTKNPENQWFSGQWHRTDLFGQFLAGPEDATAKALLWPMEQHNLLPSGLYRRPRSFTGSCARKGARGLYRRSGM